MVADELYNDQTRSYTAIAVGSTVLHYKVISGLGVGEVDRALS